ncbi:hypothetical protein QBC44DRAFT_336801 [Cladorrhinum sp. PSN332]|nr:hypothetical protein QBC44DRAFT_336801 [Cladorrhinum sp. PSN332]
MTLNGLLRLRPPRVYPSGFSNSGTHREARPLLKRHTTRTKYRQSYFNRSLQNPAPIPTFRPSLRAPAYSSAFHFNSHLRSTMKPSSNARVNTEQASKQQLEGMMKVLSISDPDSDSDGEWDWDSENDGSYTEPETLECFVPTVKAITSAFTSSSIASSPQAAGWGPFRAYWYDIFTKILAEVEANPDIPHFLTDRPCQKFNVCLFQLGSNHPGCPCCLPERTPNIRIKNKGGVTKEDLVKAVRDYLYGEHLKEPPKIWDGEVDDDLRTVEEGLVRVKEPVVWRDDRMIGVWQNPEDKSRGNKCMNWERGEIFLYVCEVGEFEERMKLKAEEKD